jgi:putative membrane-bound dehydrogenase-like protein
VPAIASIAFFSAMFAPAATLPPALADDAEWIWAPLQAPSNRPAGICYFRKSISLRGVKGGRVEIAGDSSYTLFVNGVRIGGGKNWQSLDVYNIGAYLISGRNVISVEGLKDQTGPAGLIARVTLKDGGGNVVTASTNATWKTSLQRQAGWQQPGFNDVSWRSARSLGKFGSTPPWNEETQVAADEPRSRFEVAREFRVEWVAQADDTGSLISMTFDEFGNILAGRENGPLLMIRDANRDGVAEKVSTYCEQVTNCQGILPMNGKVYVTADGPDGCALYRLADADRDGVIDQIEPLLRFQGKMHEHSPHGLRLGPDGLIYLLCGNMTKLDQEISGKGPHRFTYEGDLVQPRHEDPRGHAAGVKAPGGTVLRFDPDGHVVERYVGGLRNPYDIAFNDSGELFTWDADMEWDRGLTWHRPTRITHVVPGGEYGWRSGWAKWPDYFIDSLPGVLDTGPGSPTGLTFYDHFMYPVRYHGAMFVGDWAQGQILAVKFERQGASYTATTKVFLEGNPLNVTDLEVGPDGWLYFCTGGRGTEGGVYRVIWTGEVPPEVQDLGTGIETALRQPQIQTAWSRQRIAVVRKQLGDQWGEQLTTIVRNRAAASKVRVRAIELLQLYGPFPSAELLVELSAERDHVIRALSTHLMGIHVSDETSQRLVELLDDTDAIVRRRACEALAQGGYKLPGAKLVALLGSNDRFVAWAAAKALQQSPTENWQEPVLASKNQRVVLVGSAALLGADPSAETCLAVLTRMQEMLRTFVSDADFIDLLRVCQLALHRGEIEPADVPEFARLISAEFPSGNATMNRELVRILAYLESTEVADRFLELFNSDISATDKLHMAVHAPHFVAGWSQQQRFEMLNYFAAARNDPAGETYARYLDRVARQFVERLSDDERIAVLADGEKWPTAAIGALAKLPPNPGDEVLEFLTQLDAKIAEREGDDVEQLRTAIIAVLARSQTPAAMAYLRTLFEKEPERRNLLAMGLAQDPGGENWPLLVRSIPVVEGRMAGEVLSKLAEVDLSPEEAEPLRQLIVFGLRHNNETLRQRTIALLEHWTGESLGDPETSAADTLAEWQGWFAENYPDQPEASLPIAATTDKYIFDELYEFLSSEQGHEGDFAAGAVVFNKAQCANCHRFGTTGKDLGPDLTTISRRFHPKEILESIVYPSHVISTQYAAKTVYTVDGQILSGLVVPNPGGGVTVYDSQAKATQVAKDEIEEIAPNKISAMPTGLLNELSPQEIADLFAYLNNPPKVDVARRPQE